MENSILENYSIFKDISKLETPKSKKEFSKLLWDFLNCICELYNIEENILLKNIENEEEVYEFLIKVGVIKNRNQLDSLKDILKNDLQNILSIISLLLKRNLPIDKNLKKFMDYYRKEEVNKYLNDNESPTIVDFFCGSGGMSLGFHQNGYKIVLANDIEEVCTETFSFNHYEMPRNRILNDDIKNIVENIDSIISEKVNVVIGGPPCQGFSMANRQRVIEDPRNILYKHYVKGVEKLKPDFFIMENVKGMLPVAQQIKEDFHCLDGVDYDVHYHVFNAMDFSVPQNRERLIFLGIRSDISTRINRKASDIIKEIREYTQQMKKYVLIEAIQDLREIKASVMKNATLLDTEESGRRIEKNIATHSDEYVNLINNNQVNSLIFNHKARYNNDRDIEIFRRMIPGDKSDSERIADIMPYKNRSNIFKDKYYKLKPYEICKTITAHMKFDCNMYIHPFQARGLTPREAARVQSYPDEYFFLGAYTKTYMQIGNSVPPLMSRIIAKIIKGYL